MKTGLDTEHLPEIWVFSQQVWLSYDFVVAFLRRTVNVKNAMLDLNLPQSSYRLSSLSEMFYDVCVRQTEGEAGQSQVH
jgi:hypothetical protein